MNSQLGPYVVESELGRGGMGVVYRARDVRDGRIVALKVLLAGLSDVELLARFRREAEALRGIEHPSLVRVLAYEPNPPRPYAAFEFVAGETLRARVLRTGPLPWSEALQVVREIAEGVEVAHAAGLLHRDIKPDNVLLGSTGAKLADFGLVKDLSRDSLTQTGAMLGTPGFMAPEQALGARESFGPGTDVYGLGSTLYYALTGHPPFRGASPMGTLTALVNDPPPAPQALAPDVPQWLDRVCVRCMQKQPEQRYATCGALLAALAGAPAEPPSRAWVPALVGAGIAVVAAVAVAFGFARSTPQLAESAAESEAESEAGAEAEAESVGAAQADLPLRALRNEQLVDASFDARLREVELLIEAQRDSEASLLLRGIERVLPAPSARASALREALERRGVQELPQLPKEYQDMRRKFPKHDLNEDTAGLSMVLKSNAALSAHGPPQWHAQGVRVLERCEQQSRVMASAEFQPLHRAIVEFRALRKKGVPRSREEEEPWVDLLETLTQDPVEDEILRQGWQRLRIEVCAFLKQVNKRGLARLQVPLLAQAIWEAGLSDYDVFLFAHVLYRGKGDLVSAQVLKQVAARLQQWLDAEPPFAEPEARVVLAGILLRLETPRPARAQALLLEAFKAPDLSRQVRLWAGRVAHRADAPQLVIAFMEPELSDPIYDELLTTPYLREIGLAYSKLGRAAEWLERLGRVTRWPMEVALERATIHVEQGAVRKALAALDDVVVPVRPDGRVTQYRRRIVDIDTALVELGMPTSGADDHAAWVEFLSYDPKLDSLSLALERGSANSATVVLALCDAVTSLSRRADEHGFRVGSPERSALERRMVKSLLDAIEGLSRRYAAEYGGRRLFDRLSGRLGETLSKGQVLRCVDALCGLRTEGGLLIQSEGLEVWVERGKRALPSVDDPDYPELALPVLLLNAALADRRVVRQHLRELQLTLGDRSMQPETRIAICELASRVHAENSVTGLLEPMNYGLAFETEALRSDAYRLQAWVYRNRNATETWLKILRTHILPKDDGFDARAREVEALCELKRFDEAEGLLESLEQLPTDMKRGFTLGRLRRKLGE